MNKKLTGRQAGIALLEKKTITNRRDCFRLNLDNEVKKFEIRVFCNKRFPELIFKEIVRFEEIINHNNWELYEPEEEKKDLQVNVKVLDIPEIKNILDKSAKDLQAQQDTIDQLEQELKEKISYALSLEEKIIELEAKNKNLKAQNFLLEMMFATPEEVAEQKKSWQEVKKTLGLGE